MADDSAPAKPKKMAAGKKKAAAGGEDKPAKRQKAAAPKVAPKVSKEAAEAAAEEEQEAVSLKGAFTKDLAVMMYGYGDEPEPLPETLDLVEEIVIDYATGLMHAAMDGAAARGRLKSGATRGSAVGPEDVMFLVRKEPKKYARVKELLIMSEELKDARRMVDVAAEAAATMAHEPEGGGGEERQQAAGGGGSGDAAAAASAEEPTSDIPLVPL